jgi:5-formyltetrahydrofolate cyclo-ligase
VRSKGSFTSQMDKAELRTQLREARRAIDAPSAGRAARACARHLAGTPLWRDSTAVGLYLASDGELDPQPLLAFARNKHLFLPRLAERSLVFVPWQPGAPLVSNRYGIGEPQGKAVELHTLSLLLLPLVGFSRQGVRLGMGAGFYDRCLGALAPARRPWLIGYGYDMQCNDGLRGDHWDVPLDAVVTESGTTRCSERALNMAQHFNAPAT